MKPIMFVGTASNVGKSILAAAYCRIFARRGIKVAPFKAQNMSLNSFVTKDGGEMGRAQVVQAECAGIEPTVHMNPILLKPSSTNASQIIVQGKPVTTATAREYYKMKENVVATITDSFNILKEKYELIILEGAGSPAEINLKENDIVNMKMADIADAEVILVADIDRGGVFASVYGTLELLEPHERDRISGYIINKFRGDVSLLEPGIEMLNEKVGKKCLGVLPYFRDIVIEDEDSLALENLQQNYVDKDTLDIVVIRIPRISNFTDFNSLRGSDVIVRYVDKVNEFGSPDLIILPGSKNTIEDLIWMKRTGIYKKILELYNEKIPIIGICGGYQMLGRGIKDPNNVETDHKNIKGLGLLNCETLMSEDKNLYQANGRVVSNIFCGIEVEGYEIHNGETHVDAGENSFIELTRANSDTKIMDGIVNKDGLIFGTYLHGIFDSQEFRNKLCSYVRKIRNKSENSFNTELDYKTFKNINYDALADLVEKHIDLSKYFDISK